MHIIWGEIEQSSGSDSAEMPEVGNVLFLDASEGRSPEHIRWELRKEFEAGCHASEGGAESEDWGEEPHVVLGQVLSAVGLWSKGTWNHGVDASRPCKPCSYSHRGCRHGQDCDFCHLPHAQLPSSKLGRAHRTHCKFVAETLDVLAGNPRLHQEVSALASSASRYLQMLLERRTEAPCDEALSAGDTDAVGRRHRRRAAAFRRFQSLGTCIGSEPLLTDAPREAD